MDNPYILWALLCLAIALILFVVEIFIPSGGLIGLAAGASLITGIVLLFWVNQTLGLIGMLVTIVSLPFFLALAIKIWPETPIFRMLLLKNQPKPELRDIGTEGAADDTEAQRLVGQQGQTVTDLRPVGTCLIDGKRMECLAESGFIRSGKSVRIVSADGLQVKVREEEES